MQIDSLPPLSEVLRQHGLRAKKKFGQNFILDFNLLAKIANQSKGLENAAVLEIGAGPGGLTRALLAKGAKVFVVEYDKKCLPALMEIKNIYKDKLYISNEDALKNNFASQLESFAKGSEIKIVANLPYNIATKLLVNWIVAKDIFWQEAILMFQYEVAKRITSKQGEKDWGRLGLLCSLLLESKILFNVPRQAFVPPPKVTSSVVKLTPKNLVQKTPKIDCDLKIFEKISKAAFGQRRKMLRQSLKSLGGETLLQRAGISPVLRAQDLSLENYLSLTKAYAKSI